MAAFRHSARPPRANRRDMAFAEAAASGAGALGHLSRPAAQERITLRRVRQGLGTREPRRADAGSPPSAWRPLARFWLLLLAATAAVGGVLEYLGPPAKRPAQEQAPLEQPAGSAEAKPPAAGAPPPSPPRDSPSAADQASAAPRTRRLVVFHSAKFNGVAGTVQRLATQAGLTVDQVSTEAVANLPPRAIIRFYALEDHPAARRLGRELGQLGYAWQIENLSERPSSPEQRGLEVWLPER